MYSDQITAVILGIIEGLTEYIPVSSTGHLIIAGDILNFQGDKSKLFEVFIQLGAILTIVFLYPKFFINLIPFNLKQGKIIKSAENSFTGLDGLLKLGFGALPVFILGFLTHSFIKEKLFNSFTVAIGLFLGAILIIYSENRNKSPIKKNIQDLTIKDCLLVGLFQCLALWPGVSRSGATIIGGLLIGFERKLAAEFSFLLAVPVLSAAVLYDVYKNFNLLSEEDIPMFATGFIVSFIVALFAVKYFLNYLKQKDFKIFAYYRIILAMLVIYYTLKN